MHSVSLPVCACSSSPKYSLTAFKLVYAIEFYYRIFVLKMLYIGLMVHVQKHIKEFRYITVNNKKILKVDFNIFILP